MTKLQEIYVNQSEYYALERDEEGRLILSVLMGGVAMYELKLILNEDEKASYERRGIPFLDELANEVRRHQSRFEDRFLTNGPA